MSTLAILGGSPVISEPLPPYPSMAEGERAAVMRVMESGVVSGFLGSPGPEFFGGPEVRRFEEAWCKRYDVRHAVSMNSATSCLIAAMGAIGISPGDEVIVPPWTMSATAMAPLIYGGIPVFVDIEPETYCLDLALVRRAITERTKAIIAVNLFGHPAPLHELRTLSDQYGLGLIEDSAQAPLASEAGRLCGTIGDIGIFSLNYHKHIHAGEGGVCVTSDDNLAQRLQMIRNHGENVIDWLEVTEFTNIVGFNFRLTELGAAIGAEQLRRIDEHVERREQVAELLTRGVADLAGITPPVVRESCRHNYYGWVARCDEETLGVNRATFSTALSAEGFPHSVGYVRPLYLLPLFQRRIAIGNKGFPFSITNQTYEPGLCPVAEQLHADRALVFEPCAFNAESRHVSLLVEAIQKVHRHRADLLSLQRVKQEAASV